MRSALIAVALGGMFGLGLCAGWFFSPQDREGRRESTVQSPERKRSPPGGESSARADAGPDTVSAGELRLLREEMRSLRQEIRRLPSPATPSAEQNPESVRTQITQSPAPASTEEGRRRAMIEKRLAELGLASAGQQIQDRLAAERHAILERFQTALAPGQWNEYQAATSLGWHRQTDADRKKIQTIQTDFKNIQEEILKEQAGYWGFLTPKQKEGIEALRGGTPGSDPEGHPTVKAPLPARTFQYSMFE